MKTALCLTLTLLLAFAWNPQAHALACGDTVTHSITLDADLHCTTGVAGSAALYVRTAGVTIDLNDHTISGSASLRGIRVSDAHHVSVINGYLTGFKIGIHATRSDYLVVSDMDLYSLGAGVVASDSLAASIGFNRFNDMQTWGIYLPAYRDSRRRVLGAHVIGSNFFNLTRSAIGICGHANSDNLISSNRIYSSGAYGIHLFDGSSDNQVRSNLLETSDGTGIVLRGSRRNQVVGNSLFMIRKGIALIPEFSGDCGTGPYRRPEVRDNRIKDNSVTIATTAVIMGIGNRKRPLVFLNRIQKNNLVFAETGLHFRADAIGNIGTGNTFSFVTTPVRDQGYWNLH